MRQVDVCFVGAPMVRTEGREKRRYPERAQGLGVVFRHAGRRKEVGGGVQKVKKRKVDSGKKVKKMKVDRGKKGGDGSGGELSGEVFHDVGKGLSVSGEEMGDGDGAEMEIDAGVPEEWGDVEDTVVGAGGGAAASSEDEAEAEAKRKREKKERKERRKKEKKAKKERRKSQEVAGL